MHLSHSRAFFKRSTPSASRWALSREGHAELPGRPLGNHTAAQMSCWKAAEIMRHLKAQAFPRGEVRFLYGN